jgi:hypothetical protein
MDHNLYFLNDGLYRLKPIFYRLRSLVYKIVLLLDDDDRLAHAGS